MNHCVYFMSYSIQVWYLYSLENDAWTLRDRMFVETTTQHTRHVLICLRSFKTWYATGFFSKTDDDVDVLVD